MWLTDKKTILALAVAILLGEIIWIVRESSGLELFWWHDMVLHFSGGVLIAMIFLGFTEEYKNWWSNAGALQTFVSTISIVVLIGVLWEFYEFGTSYFLKSITLTLPDTLSDLFLDGLGGAFLSVFYIFLTKKR